MKKLNLILAWSVHILTAFGLIIGLYSIISIINEDYNLLLKLTILAIIIDGIDGTLARKLKIKELIPTINGELLDNIVDYINYAFIPTIFFYYSNFIKNEYKTMVCIGILLATIYQFSRTDAKTSDDYFKGFPSLWNFLIIFNTIFTINQITNLSIIILCIIFSFAPIKFIYPSKTKEFKHITYPITVIIILLAIPIIIVGVTNLYLRIYGIIIIFYCSYITLTSIYLHYKTRKK
ncbi:phosphatidyltransferase [Borrelia miyamotoi]|uniref:Phosphatidylcholine synthase n=1 Tax=Borrelia miyamotoi TaxID=47466 RepID=A0AAX3JMR7_9SPIR|nr:CDP-alcohol phosphatidyltransferase family protein [Borrelia miyamotoi]QFP42069.1 phosphatidyltransferase [Borrelia miyamotoi]QFP48185.1 CDP-alcohol phosphatidyltransferase family protein [Borrelia miyamotoi]QGT55944.1 phosphatidyltransferase [Borrelia miyamotoi]QGT56724.1 phosphatidyltransferase [Borrelia miyamotoi]WAZ71984.1 CDP-alcohol phosphatidyltransferase family protein [Borrelia miyamotoi]